MNTSDYISDGIIESYVLGFITPEDKEKLDQAMVLFPELAAELAEVERRMERTAFNMAVKPPEELKKKFLEMVKEHEEMYMEAPEQEKIFVGITPPVDRMTVHRGWKVVLIVYLALMVLALAAMLLYYFVPNL
ncbi:hypothetical protein [Chitinophaga sp.]|uniref:hypothetical protein n=1 Tax=Chitinophaga sp. TaxID=1869181 RepID=UPI0031D8B10B